MGNIKMRTKFYSENAERIRPSHKWEDNINRILKKYRVSMWTGFFFT